VEKITKKITIWAKRTIPYVGRVALINSVLMGVFNFWVNTFMLPKGVIKELERLYRNYLWGASEVYKRIPYVA